MSVLTRGHLPLGAGSAQTPMTSDLVPGPSLIAAAKSFSASQAPADVQVWARPGPPVPAAWRAGATCRSQFAAAAAAQTCVPQRWSARRRLRWTRPVRPRQSWQGPARRRPCVWPAPAVLARGGPCGHTAQPGHGGAWQAPNSALGGVFLLSPAPTPDARRDVTGQSPVPGPVSPT